MALGSRSHLVKTSTAIPARLVSLDSTVSSNFSTYEVRVCHRASRNVAIGPHLNGWERLVAFGTEEKIHGMAK